MAKTLGQLRLAVAGFMQREPSTFVRTTVAEGSVDLLTNAINNARLYAERQIDFERSKVSVVFKNATTAGGVDISTAVLASDGVTAVRVKKIRTPFLPLADGQQYPVDLVSKRQWDMRLKRRFAAARPTDTSQYAFLTNSAYCIVQDGTNLFAAPPDTNVLGASYSIYADVIKWLDDYSTTMSATDFILDFCFDWMMYKSIQELNYYLKEDERVMLSAKLVSDSWDAMVKWNTELQEANVDDVNLD